MCLGAQSICGLEIGLLAEWKQGDQEGAESGILVRGGRAWTGVGRGVVRLGEIWTFLRRNQQDMFMDGRMSMTDWLGMSSGEADRGIRISV